MKVIVIVFTDLCRLWNHQMVHGIKSWVYWDDRETDEHILPLPYR